MLVVYTELFEAPQMRVYGPLATTTALRPADDIAQRSSTMESIGFSIFISDIAFA